MVWGMSQNRLLAYIKLPPHDSNQHEVARRGARLYTRELLVYGHRRADVSMLFRRKSGNGEFSGQKPDFRGRNRARTVLADRIVTRRGAGWAAKRLKGRTGHSIGLQPQFSMRQIAPKNPPKKGEHVTSKNLMWPDAAQWAKKNQAQAKST